MSNDSNLNYNRRLNNRLNTYVNKNIACKKCESTNVISRKESNLYGCLNCRSVWEISKPLKDTKSSKNKTIEKSDTFFSSKWLVIILLLGLGIVTFLIKSTETSSESITDLVKELKKKYPSQNSDTWYKILAAVNKEEPTVKSIILLHEEDKRTANCLVEDLLLLFNDNKMIELKDITFSNFSSETEDYGLALKHYYSIVSQHKVLITDLSEVNGNIARIFHTLCDEFSFDIKPTFFIFTLRYNKSNEHLLPTEMATHTLKKLWKDLGDHEFFPLMSRIVKIVFYVIPEKNNC